VEVLERRVSRGKIVLRAEMLGEDIVVFLTGGAVHAGAVAVAACDPEKGYSSTSVITLPGHLEDTIAHPEARKISTKSGRNVVFICGIHFEAITEEEITEIVDAASDLADELIRIMEDN
jgi:hypothetical protein